MISSVKFDDNHERLFYVQNIAEHRYSWNEVSHNISVRVYNIHDISIVV